MSEALTPLLVVFDELDYIACQWEGTSLGNMFCISGLICKPLFCSIQLVYFSILCEGYTCVPYWQSPFKVILCEA